MTFPPKRQLRHRFPAPTWTISRKGVCIGPIPNRRRSTFRFGNVYPPLSRACISSCLPGFLQSVRDRAMTSDVGADGGTDSVICDIRRLSQISNQTSLMTIDAVLRALPRDGQGYAAAAAEL